MSIQMTLGEHIYHLQNKILNPRGIYSTPVVDMVLDTWQRGQSLCLGAKLFLSLKIQIGIQVFPIEEKQINPFGSDPPKNKPKETAESQHRGTNLC